MDSYLGCLLLAYSPSAQSDSFQKNLDFMIIYVNNSFCTLFETLGTEIQKSAPHFFLGYSSLVHDQSFRENGISLIYETRNSKTPKIALLTAYN